MYGWADNGRYRIEKEPKQRTCDLDGYLDLSKKVRDAKPRAITGEDLEVICMLRQRAHEMNVLIADVITVAKVLRRMKDKRVYAITNNLFRVVMSLQRQRDKVYATLRCFKVLKPEPYEMEYIRKLNSAVVKRVKFLREKILPENIALTPIAEYLEAVGSASLTEDIFREVGSRKKLAELFEEGTQESELDRYVERILAVVAGTGKGDAYKERIAKWYARSERLHAERVAEQELERNERRLEEAEAGLREFREAFQRAISTLEGRTDIGLAQQTMEKLLLKHRGKWMLLRCESRSGRVMRRYYTEKGEWSQKCWHAKAFTEESECLQVLAEVKAAEPWKAYDAVQL